MRSLAFLAKGKRSKPLNYHRAGLAFANGLLWQKAIFKISEEIDPDFQKRPWRHVMSRESRTASILLTGLAIATIVAATFGWLP